MKYYYYNYAQIVSLYATLVTLELQPNPAHDSSHNITMDTNPTYLWKLQVTDIFTKSS